MHWAASIICSWIDHCVVFTARISSLSQLSSLCIQSEFSSVDRTTCILSCLINHWLFYVQPLILDCLSLISTTSSFFTFIMISDVWLQEWMPTVYLFTMWHRGTGSNMAKVTWRHLPIFDIATTAVRERELEMNWMLSMLEAQSFTKGSWSGMVKTRGMFIFHPLNIRREVNWLADGVMVQIWLTVLNN